MPSRPTAIRLCRYSGGNDRPSGKLVRGRLIVNRAVVIPLVREFNRLPPVPSGVIACPGDDGSEVVALFAYPHGRRVAVALKKTGCEGVTNGDFEDIADGFGRAAQFGPQLVAKLQRLTE